MAVITLTGSGTISTAESTTGWTGDTFELEPDIKVEGSNSVACAQTTNGNNDIYFSGSWDLSNKHIRLFFNMSFVPNMAATDPIHIYLIGGATEYIVYYATNAEYSGGWVDMLIDCELFTTVTLASVTGVGVRVQTASKPRNQPQNTWVDHWRYSDGMEITSSTTEAVSLKDAADLDAVKPDGILSDIDGVLFASGEILLGNTGTSNANIVSVNEQIVFPDRFVTSTLYKLKTQEGGTGNTDIDITGLVCKTVGGSSAEIDFSSTLNSLSIIASVFIDMGASLFTSTVSSPVFERNSFTGCGATTLNWNALDTTWNLSEPVTLTSPATLTGCNFINATGAVSLSCSDLDSLFPCNFVSDGSNHAVELTSLGGGSMGWDNILDGYVTGTVGSPVTPTSTGNEAIYVNVGSGTLTINLADGASIPSIRSAGATVNVVAGQKTFTQIISPTPSPNYEYRLYEVTAEGSLAGAVEITAEGEENATSGSHSYSHAETNQPVAVQIISNDYIEKISYYTLTAADLTVTINLELDNND